jgi:integrase
MKNHGGGWNKGAAVGRRTAFTKQELKQIGQTLARDGNYHDLCLLALGLDTMLRSSDLLSLTVAHVCHPNGAIRKQLRRKQQKTKHNVYPALTAETRHHIRQWIEISGKQSNHFLFTSTKLVDAPAIGRGQYARKVKQWSQWVGKPSADYSTHSIRRSKPRHMYQQSEDIALISRLLGHKSPAVTLDYLGIEQDQADAATLRHVMLGKLG